jgi:hypothetical protein
MIRPFIVFTAFALAFGLSTTASTAAAAPSRADRSQGEKVSPTAGRDHNRYGFTMWLAGGGTKGGYVHGATDEFGFKAVQDRVHVHDLQATVLHILGLDYERLTYRHSGRDFRLADVHGHVVHRLLA